MHIGNIPHPHLPAKPFNFSTFQLFNFSTFQLDAEGAVATVSSTWYIIRTKPRTEKKLLAYLQAWHAWNIFPSYEKVRKVQRRTVKSELPLFPCYILARLDNELRLRTLKTNLTLSLTPVNRPRTVLRSLHQAIKAVKTARETGDFRLVAPTAVGDIVRIAKGPMKGLTGRVKTVDGTTTLVINVEAFGSAIEITVSPEDL